MQGSPTYGSVSRAVARRAQGDPAEHAPGISLPNSPGGSPLKGRGDEGDSSPSKREDGAANSPSKRKVKTGASATTSRAGVVVLGVLCILFVSAWLRRPKAAPPASKGGDARYRELIEEARTIPKDKTAARAELKKAAAAVTAAPAAVVSENVTKALEDAANLMAAQAKAEKALLFHTKQMSQAQLAAAMSVMSDRHTRHIEAASPRGKRAGGASAASSSRKPHPQQASPKGPSPCLGSSAPFKPPGSLRVTNEGGRLSHWVKELGGPDDPKYVHMAMVERLGNGSLVAMWQQAVQAVEGSEEQEIRYKVSVSDAGDSWFPEQRLGVHRSGALWSPVMHFQGGVLHVLYSESRDCIRGATATNPPRWFPGGDIKMTTSADKDLLRWARPRVVLSQDAESGVPKVLANKLIVRSSGEWVLPFWREIPRGGKALTKGKCATSLMRASAGVLVSRNQGESWRAHGEITHSLTWLIENSVVEIAEDKSLLMLFRSWAGRIFQSRSTDGGKSWSHPSPTSLPNPDAKIHVIALKDSDDLLLAYNDHQKYAEDGFTAFRTGLRLAISHDRGETWARVAEVDEVDEPGWQFHYPTLMQYGCNVTVAYTRAYVESHEEDTERPETPPDSQRPGIRMMTFDLSLLSARDEAGAAEARRQ